MRNLAAILEAAGSCARPTSSRRRVFLQDLGDFAAMNEVYARHVGDRPPARSTSRWRSCPPARSSRSRRSPHDRRGRPKPRAALRYRRGTISRCRPHPRLHPLARHRRIRRRRRRARRAARDRARRRGFPRPRRRPGGPARALTPHGRVEDMEVHGQLVGVRFHPRDRAVAALVRSGIELTPPRAERRTGPGHRDFEIVSDPVGDRRGGHGAP